MGPSIASPHEASPLRYQSIDWRHTARQRSTHCLCHHLSVYMFVRYKAYTWTKTIQTIKQPQCLSTDYNVLLLFLTTTVDAGSPLPGYATCCSSTLSSTPQVSRIALKYFPPYEHNLWSWEIEWQYHSKVEGFTFPIRFPRHCVGITISNTVCAPWGKGPSE